MSRARRLPGQARELAVVVATATRTYRASPVAILRRARRVRSELGFEYTEALRSGVLDPALPDRERMQYLSKHSTASMQGRLNPPELLPLTEDKLIFQRYCEALGLPVPTLLATVGRSTAWSPAGPIDGPEDFARLVGDELPDDFVVKPSSGYHGDGVRIVSRVDGRLHVSPGGVLDPRDLYRELAEDPRFGIFLIQERLRNHPDVARLGNGQALQTVRVVSLMDRHGEPGILRARMRVSLGDASIDNWRGGTTGNGAMPVNPRDGVLGALTLPRADGCGPQPARDAPATGTSLPEWDRVLELVKRASRGFLPIRTIGWDIAITERGPVIIEANQVWDPFPDPAPEVREAMSAA